MKEVTLKELGNRVREVRHSRGWSQEQLADLSGIHRTYVSSLERGQRNVSVLTLSRIAKGLRVTAAFLLTATRHAIKGPKKFR